MPGKRVQFDEETFRALDLLARDSMKSFQELADEAFSDLLRKHGRPTSLREALRKSTAERNSEVGRTAVVLDHPARQRSRAKNATMPPRAKRKRARR